MGNKQGSPTSSTNSKEAASASASSSSAPSAASAAAAAQPHEFVIPARRANGYPSLLPGSAMSPPHTTPYWYDCVPVTQLWSEHLSKVTHHRVVQPMQYRPGDALPPPKPAGHLRCICLSDTHNYHDRLPFPMPASLGVDALLHAGDFTNVGAEADVVAFTQWIRDLPIKYKIVIAGNHDVSYDEAKYATELAKRFRHRTILDPKKIKADLVEGYAHGQPMQDNPFPKFAEDGGVAYLEDTGISVQGIRVWGSPWQPEFFACQGFNLVLGEELRQKWDLIPTETDVLITHGPPVGHGDLCLPAEQRAGCVDLLAEIQTRIKPRYHLFGHIHEGYGQTTDGVTDYINASNCNLKYDANNLNPIILIDVPIPVAASSNEPRAAL